MTSKEILNICKEIESQQLGSYKVWDIDSKRLIYDYTEKPSVANHVNYKEARISLEKDGTEVGYCHILPYREAPQEVPDNVVRLLGDKYISMEITASGKPQEYEEGDDEYDFWEWVIDHNDSCLVYETYTGNMSSIEVAFDGDALDDFCERFCIEDGCIEAKLVYVGAVCVDISEVLPLTRDIEKLWKNRPAGLRKDW